MQRWNWGLIVALTLALAFWYVMYRLLVSII